MESRRFYMRVAILVLLLGMMLSVFSYALYDLQVLRGEDFLAQSKRRSGTVATVEASRGQILDRYGRLLVSNRLSYNLSLSSTYLGEAEVRNETLLRLIALCDEYGVAYRDSLSLSPALRALPLENNTFTSYIAAKKWEMPSTGAQLLALMREAYELDPALSDKEACRLAGVCYELDLRAAGVTVTPYIFAEDVDVEFISIVTEHGWNGINVETASMRQYHTQYAAHLLGRVGPIYSEEWDAYKELGYSLNAIVGKDGVEKAFEAYLHGTAGTSVVDKSESGKIVGETVVTAPQPGGNVQLTLDIKFQEAVEKALADFTPGIEGAEGAAAVAIKIGTGEVLAAASYPTFDLANFGAVYNDLLQDPLTPMVNRAFQGVYAPGSTFKMVPAVAALEEGLITTSTKIRDTGRFTVYPDYQPMCWIYRQFGGTHGLIDVTQALNVSCNVFFYTLGYQMGIDLLNYYADLFGLGSKTGVEVPEVVGSLASPAYTESVGGTWFGGETLSAVIGQSYNQFTPVQLANYVSTLVGGGDHYSAHLLKSVSSYDFSETVMTREPELVNQIEIQDSTLAAVKAGLLRVTSSGGSSYRYFRDFDIPVGAKTGSAQVSAASNSNAVFVCFAPYDEPEIALAIVVEKGGTGSELGAVARTILEYYFSADSTMDAIETEGTLLR